MAFKILRYRVPGVSCAHCSTTISQAVGKLEGVESVVVDLEQKLVTVIGATISDASARAAIDDAGYDIAHLQEDAA
jgi:copper chaperone